MKPDPSMLGATGLDHVPAVEFHNSGLAINWKYKKTLVTDLLMDYISLSVTHTHAPMCSIVYIEVSKIPAPDTYIFPLICLRWTSMCLLKASVFMKPLSQSWQLYLYCPVCVAM